jgi:butyryl-CoA dehydrogenase
MPAAKKVADELLAGPALGGSAPTNEPLAAETALVGAAKKTFLFAAGVAVQRFADKLGEEQEVAAALSDIVTDVFAAESALLRAGKSVAQRGAERTAVPVAMMRVFVHEAADRIENHARTALAACAEGDTLRTQLALLRRLLKREPVNTIALRRQVARAVIDARRYPL